MTTSLLLSAFLSQTSLAAELSVSELIVERQQSYNNLDERLDTLIDLAETKNVNWTKVDLLTTDLVEDISFIKTAFPKGSTEKSRARPRIWDNMEDFNERLNELNQSILAAKKASDNKDGRALIEAWDNADDTCNSCHRRYREFW